MSGLKNCPLCKGLTKWCDSEPDEDGDMHVCDHIICTECKMSFIPTCEASYNADSFEEMKQIALYKFNTRADTTTGGR